MYCLYVCLCRCLYVILCMLVYAGCELRGSFAGAWSSLADTMNHFPTLAVCPWYQSEADEEPGCETGNLLVVLHEEAKKT